MHINIARLASSFPLIFTGLITASEIKLGCVVDDTHVTRGGQVLPGMRRFQACALVISSLAATCVSNLVRGHHTWHYVSTCAFKCAFFIIRLVSHDVSTELCKPAIISLSAGSVANERTRVVMQGVGYTDCRARYRKGKLDGRQVVFA